MVYFDSGFNSYFVHRFLLLPNERTKIYNQYVKKAAQKRKLLNTSKPVIKRQVLSLCKDTFAYRYLKQRKKIKT